MIVYYNEHNSADSKVPYVVYQCMKYQRVTHVYHCMQHYNKEGLKNPNWNTEILKKEHFKHFFYMLYFQMIVVQQMFWTTMILWFSENQLSYDNAQPSPSCFTSLLFNYYNHY